METDLIFDIGLHRGEDTEFYLKKGFRVIGVEANEALCAETAERLFPEIKSGQLTIVNKAVTNTPGVVNFHVNTKISVWSTLDPEWANRNLRLRGAESKICQVQATTLADLIVQFGTPYYVKLDIEGRDLQAIESLAGHTDLPKYISIESDKDSFRTLRREFAVMESLGYNAFTIVDQPGIARQIPPNPAREGRYCKHQFAYGSSGLFGGELPGPWLTADAAIEAYRPIFLRYALTGDDPFVKPYWMRRLLCRLGFASRWYDTHARLG
jgi:FkbM family methyltransferase